MSRRASLGFVTFEALLIAAVVGLVSLDYGITGPTAVGVGIIAFFAVLVILQIPLVGFVAGIVLSVVWGWFAFSLAVGASLLLAVVVAVVVGAISLSLHLGFSR